MQSFNGLILLRYSIAIIFLSHGAMRIYIEGGVYNFGELFLNRHIGLSPLGLPIAWTVTIMEFVGSILLIMNKYTKPVCYWFIFKILTGIALVHFKEGWFVVGAGRNGMEYSFLIICSLLAVAFPERFEL
jgi:putative oxidoreductase